MTVRRSVSFLAIIVGGSLSVALLHGQPASPPASQQPPKLTNRRGLVEVLQLQGLNNPPVGSVLAFSGKWSSDKEKLTGWMLCDGRTLKAHDYPELAAALGDGSSDVQIPNLAGHTVIGSGTGSEGGAALTERKLNDHGGEEAHTLTVDEMPGHTHGVNDPGHVHGNVPTDEGQVGQAGRPRSVTSWFHGSQNTSRATTGISIQSAGGGRPHNSMPPYCVLHYIIKVTPIPNGR